jgi:hypothetical protein
METAKKNDARTNPCSRHTFVAILGDQHCMCPPVKNQLMLDARLMSDSVPTKSLITADTPDIAPHRRPLTEADAVDIWLARWLKVPRKAILARYGCDPRRLYEIWEGSRFPGSRCKALDRLQTMYPGVIDRIDPGTHRRIPRTAHPDQLSFFD